MENNYNNNANEQASNNEWNGQYGYYNQPQNGAPNANYNTNMNYNTNPQGYYYNTNKPNTNGFAIASLVLGILSLFGALCFGVFGIVFGILAIIFGFVSKSRQTTNQAEMSGLGLAGVISGFIGFFVGAMFLGLIIYAGVNSDNKNSIFYIEEEYSNDIYYR